MKKRFLTFQYTVKLLWSMISPVSRAIALIFLVVAVVLIATSSDPVGWGLFCGSLLVFLVICSIVIFRMISKELDK